MHRRSAKKMSLLRPGAAAPHCGSVRESADARESLREASSDCPSTESKKKRKNDVDDVRYFGDLEALGEGCVAQISICKLSALRRFKVPRAFANRRRAAVRGLRARVETYILYTYENNRTIGERRSLHGAFSSLTKRRYVISGS